MDVSADLTELGRTPVAVVCAGAKSVLDIPRTLEYLETQGVCVAAYGTDEFPAFFTPRSGCRAPCRFDTPAQAASAIYAIQKLQLQSGMVIGVPIPPEHAAQGVEVEAAIQTALAEAESKQVQGNDVTPFLLKRIREITGGKSLEANIALVKNNAIVGSRIAAALAELALPKDAKRNYVINHCGARGGATFRSASGSSSQCGDGVERSQVKSCTAAHRPASMLNPAMARCWPASG
jgi:pseudouridine-5'-phosphate glycosidase